MTNLPRVRMPDAHATALDEQLSRSLRPIALVLSAVYLASLVHRAADPVLAAMPPMAVVPMVVFLLLALLPSWRPLPPQLANPVLVAVMGMVAVEALVQGPGTGSHVPWALIGLGGVALRPRWALAAAAAIVAPWAVLTVGGIDGWAVGQWGLALDMAAAAAIGTVVFLARRRAVLGLVTARGDLHHLAHTDPLTALRNRRGLEQAAAEVQASRPGAGLQLVYVDLDGFQAVNDRLGHVEGDRALAAVADILRTTFRAADVIGRVGADEFVVIVAPGSDAGIAARRLLDRLAAWRDPQNRYVLRASVGVADVAGTTPESFWAAVDAADLQMCAEKRSRRAAATMVDVDPWEPAAPSSTMTPALG